mgnify:CR=1 FL=1
MATSANSPSWVRTYTKDDATKYQIAYRSNNTWRVDAKGKAVPGSFTTNLQVDRVAIDANVTGGGTSATWTTAATRGPGANGVWTRQYLDDDDTTLGYALPDVSWSDLNDRKSNFNSQVSNVSANAIAKYFRTLGFGRGSGLSTQEGAIREISRSQGSNSQGNSSEDTIGANQSLRTLPELEVKRNREKYQSRYTYYYPVGLKYNYDQDKLLISVLEYKPRPINRTTHKDGTKTLGIGQRAGYTSRVLGSVFLPTPGNIGDTNSVNWGESSINPAQLAAANTFFENVGKEMPVTSVIKDVGKIAESIGENSGDVKDAIAASLAKAATGGDILTRSTGQIVNPNMELLFKNPVLRDFSFSWKMSPRDEEESRMILKIVRMFKQSQAVKRTKSQVFLKSPNTYKLQWLTGNKEHSYLPKIKEVALKQFAMTYTPDGNYQVYENSSMVSYNMTMTFGELEPIYHDDYSNLDQDRDESIGF